MYSAIAKNKLNTVLIILVFLVILGALGALAAWLTGEWWIAALVLGGAAIYALIQYFAATRETLAISGAIEVSKADEPRLYRIVENLAISEGLPTPKVYVIPDPAPNAFAMGRDPEHAVVAATTGLLEIMDDQELQGVMAHELGHIENYDIRVSLIVFGLVVAIIAPLLASIVRAAVSRQREYLADATGALTTRHPEGLARALEKLDVHGRPVTRTNTSMSHLWVVDPNEPGFVQRLFATHPPIQSRIARLRENAARF
jgi:heat shock protein HtpX